MYKDLIYFVNIILLVYVLVFVPFSTHQENNIATNVNVIKYNLSIDEQVKQVFQNIDYVLWVQIEANIETLLRHVYADDRKKCFIYLKKIEGQLNSYIFKDIYDFKTRKRIKIEIDNLTTTLENLITRKNNKSKVVEYNFNEYFDK